MGLAGPKNKQRISVDPQNRQWADDQDKMGYKMLKSMGWSSGKGLGKNEDGRAEHVKVSLKSNNLGIGADKRSIDNWMDNTFAFSSLLENLNKELENEITEEEVTTTTTTVVKKKKKSKKGIETETKEEVDEVVTEEVETTKTVEGPTMRQITSSRLMHRRKFHANKNVAAFSEDALNKILGVKSTPAATSAPIEEIKDDEEPSALEKLKQDTTINTRTATVDLQNYFASKMPAALLNSGRQLLVSGMEGKKKRKARDVEEEEEDEERPSFGGLGLGSGDGGGLGFSAPAVKGETEEEDNEEPMKMGSAATAASLAASGLGFGRFGGRSLSSFVKSSGETSVTEQLKMDEETVDADEDIKTLAKKDKKSKKAKASKFADEDDDEGEEEAPTKNKEKKDKKEKKERRARMSKDVETEEEEERDESKTKKEKKLKAKKSKDDEDADAEEPKKKKKRKADDAEDEALEEKETKPKKNKSKRDKWGNRIA